MAMLSEERKTIPLGQLVSPAKRPVTIEDETTYEQVTVRIRGRGLTSRGTARGSKIGTKKQYRVHAGDLLVSKIDARNGGLGLVPGGLDNAVVTGDFPAYEIDSDVCVPEYLDIYVKRSAFWDECLLVSEGSTNRVRLVPEQFLELEVELPRLAVQERVIAVVALLDVAAAARARELEATQSVFRAAREHLLATEDGWEEDLPEGWSSTTLGEVADIRSGITKGRKTRGDLRPVTFIRAANVQDGWLDLGELKTLDVTDDEVERFKLKGGDVLMTEGGNAEHVGRGWLWEDAVPEAVAQNHVFRVRVQDREVVEPRFLAYAIGAQPARDYCLGCAKKTTNLASINKTQVTEMVVPIPPLAVQEDIVRQLDALRTSADRTQRLNDANAVLRTSLIEDLVTGVREPPMLG